MSDVSRWRDSGHLERAVQTAGGQETFDARSPRCWTTSAAGGWRNAQAALVPRCPSRRFTNVDVLRSVAVGV
jgi:hypothetical protein